MKKYLNKFVHKYKYTKNHTVQTVKNIHGWCKDQSVYTRARTELIEILLLGFFVWVAMFPFVAYNPIWFIPSYGIIPWFALMFKNEWVKK